MVETATGQKAGTRSLEEQRKYIDSLWLLCLLTVVAAISNRPAGAFDADLWWHLRTGNWILQHHVIPVHDVFSWSTMGKPWVAYSWLFDVLLAQIYRFAGLHGILTFSTLMMLACMAGLVMLLMLYTTLLRAIAIAAVAFVALIPLESPRPWLFTILFFIAEFYLLLQARERGKAAWLLPVLPLFTLWANVHVQFVYGLAAIGLFALEGSLAPLLQRWTRPLARLHAAWFWALLPASVLATLLNPYGWRLYRVVSEYAGQRVLLWFVQEMHPLQVRDFTAWAALLLFCAAIFALASMREKCPLIAGLLAVSCAIAFPRARDVWFLAIASALTLAYSMRTVEIGTRPFRSTYWAIALPLALALTFAMLHSTDDSALQKASAKQFPEKASSFIESHHLQNPLYSTFSWGGYLIWRLPNMPVSMDGRTNVHDDAALGRFANSWLGRKGWADDPELMKANTILLERDCALASILRSDSRFRLVYEDDLASVFQPVRTALLKAP